jgi:epoxyqueuosine reductase
MKAVLRKAALALGFDACRFTTAAPPESAPRLQAWLREGRHGEMAYLERNASRRIDPRQILPGARSIVTLAVSYHGNQPPEDSVPGSASALSRSRGLVARYARYEDYHDLLGKRLNQLAEILGRAGGPETRSLYYVDTGPVLERDLAQRAGLGFIGKHTNLISRSLGNWIFLGEIITTLEVEPDEPETNRCGRCARCLEACPTKAITAPFHLDARRCISYLTIELKGSIPVEFRPAVGNRIFGCDDCLEICPWNRFARESRFMQSRARPDLAQPDLVGLLSLNEASFQRRFAGTPLRRSKRRGLLRNVCVALGNIGDRAALPALEKAAHDPEPLVAEHARWAIDQIQKRAQPSPPIQRPA